MTYTMNRRRTAQPFRFTAPDPYWRKPESYAQALTALHTDALDNYVGGDVGPRPERFMLTELIAAAALNVGDLAIPFQTKNLFGSDKMPDEGMFAITPCYPYAARHYANVVEDMRDFAIASLERNAVGHIDAFGSLPALLQALANNLHALTQLERRPPLNPRYEQTRIAVEYSEGEVAELRAKHGGV